MTCPEQTYSWPIGTRLFDRLAPGVRPGDTVTLTNGQRARVDTAKLADDLKDAKCTVVIVESCNARVKTAASDRTGRSTHDQGRAR